MERLNFLPCKAWIDNNGDIFRAYFVHDECPESPREWDSASVMVDFSRYSIGDENSRESCEEWLVRETGISEDWYYSHKSYGLEGLIKRFKKEKCRAFSFLSVYDHSCIELYEGRGSGWDTSCIGFAYVPKSEKLTKKDAERAISGEVKLYNMYLQGSVYACIVEKLVDGEWEFSDALGGNYIDNEEDAIDVISSYFSGKAELKDAEDLLEEIAGKGLDVIAYGQAELFSA